ncbi:hypothetical protein C8J56DRAFT_933394 [Mycena floridula]|nr:hypothetical protein C8J56DRAFT_933394 [Mycena floridula]
MLRSRVLVFVLPFFFGELDSLLLLHVVHEFLVVFDACQADDVDCLYQKNENREIEHKTSTPRPVFSCPVFWSCHAFWASLRICEKQSSVPNVSSKTKGKKLESGQTHHTF